MIDFSSVSSVTACVLAAGCSLLVARLAVRVSELRDRLHNFEASLSRLSGSLQSEGTGALGEKLTQLEETVEVLANRVKMQKVRNAANHVPDRAAVADPYKDPDTWRKQVNAKLARDKFGLAKT